MLLSVGILFFSQCITPCNHPLLFFLQKFHRDLPNTTVYAYGASPFRAAFPGPTIEAIVGDPHAGAAGTLRSCS